jgi:hypothetical protein
MKSRRRVNSTVIRFLLSEVWLMKHVLAVFLVVTSLAVCAPPAQACFCLLPELSDSFKDARSVFLGQTIRIDKPKTLDENAPITERAFTVKFKIIRSWKGVPFAASEFSILWLTNCYECLALPDMNEKYLAFADPLRDTETWSLVTMCNRTVVVRGDSKPIDPEINPERDMKQLDVITERAFTFAQPRHRGRV